MKHVWLLGVLAVASFAVADEATDEELEEFQGRWQVVSLVVNGMEAPARVVKQMTWVIEGKEIVLGGPKEAKGSFTIDPSKSPKEFDLTALDGDQKGKTLQGIYGLKDGTLKLCLGDFSSASKGRPKDFKSAAGDNSGVVVLERAKE